MTVKITFSRFMNYLKLVFIRTASDTLAFLKEFREDLIRNLFELTFWLVVSFLGASGFLQVEKVRILLSFFGNWAPFIGMVILLLLYFVMRLLFYTPIQLFYEQKQKAELYTTNGIDVVGFVPSEHDVRPAGIMITNKKDVVLSCCAKMKRFWSNRTQKLKEHLPKNLRWYDDGRLEVGYTEIQKGETALIALEHIPTASERNAQMLIVLPEFTEQEDFGKSVGLEFGGELGIAIYETRTYQAEIQFLFTVEGLHLKPTPLQFSLDFTGEKLIVKKMSDWEEKK